MVPGQLVVSSVDMREVQRLIGTKFARYVVAEVGRVNRRSRFRIRRNILQTVRKKRLVSRKFKEKEVKRWVHDNPKRNAVTRAEIMAGFRLTTEVSNIRANLWIVPKTTTRIVKTSRGRRYLIQTQVGGRMRREYGAFWGVWQGEGKAKKLRWKKRLGSNRGVGLARPGYPNVKPMKGGGDLGLVLGPSLATVLRESGDDKKIVTRGQFAYVADMRRSVGGLVARINSGAIT